jgi:hypothetical protein
LKKIQIKREDISYNIRKRAQGKRREQGTKDGVHLLSYAWSYANTHKHTNSTINLTLVCTQVKEYQRPEYPNLLG